MSEFAGQTGLGRWCAQGGGNCNGGVWMERGDAFLFRESRALKRGGPVDTTLPAGGSDNWNKGFASARNH
jgi:hypothetical protein